MYVQPSIMELGSVSVFRLYGLFGRHCENPLVIKLEYQ